jgi:hypothetical protein
MQPDGQSFVRRVGTQIGGALKDLTHQGSGIVPAAQSLPDHLHPGGLGPVGDQLNGIHQVLLVRP